MQVLPLFGLWIGVCLPAPACLGPACLAQASLQLGASVGARVEASVAQAWFSPLAD
jgi:hypothetical protein